MGKRHEKIRLLFIDDDDQLLQTYMEPLAELGVDVECASNGISGKTKAWKNVYDVIVTDINMPGLNGLRVIDQLRGGCLNRNVPVIVVSGDRFHLSDTEKKRHGISAVLTKPFSPDALIESVTSSVDYTYDVMAEDVLSNRLVNE